MTSYNDAQEHETFYRELTLRNSGFIGDRSQLRLRQAGILVAGCGSTGGSVLEPLVRSGAENLFIADNGRYELNNANRQNMTLGDIDRLKVDVFRDRLTEINPWLNIDARGEGITPDNVDALVEAADVIVDAVDVTTRSGLEMKFLLHRVCHEQRKPVICGYDMALAQYIPVFDYRRGDLDVLGGELTARQVATLEPMQACTLLVPPEYIPADMFRELQRQQNGKDFTSQLAIAANLFGTLATALVVDLLDDTPVKPVIYMDVRNLIRDRMDPDDYATLKAGRDFVRQWQHEQTDPDPGFLSRSIQHYRVPRLSALARYHNALIDDRNGLLTFALPQADTEAALAKAFLRFAFVHYADVGFINQDAASLNQWHAEPLSHLSPDDIHVVIVSARDYQLLAYSTLKGPISRGQAFSDPARPLYSVESAFGPDTFRDIREMQHLTVEAVREVGRVTKAETGDPALSARVGLRLLSAYRRVLSAPDQPIDAIVGDGEEKVTLRNLQLFGFKPMVLSESTTMIPEEHLFYPRYHGRHVQPFWLLTRRFDHVRGDAMDSLSELDDTALPGRLAEEKARITNQGV